MTLTVKKTRFITALPDLTVRDVNGCEQPLSAWHGKVLLIVNVASQCGFTPQYRGLDALHRRYGCRGFSVLGFPCNQFGSQEPGDEAEILRFCQTRYDVSFPLFAKIQVNGPDAHPLYRWLKRERPGLFGTETIKWNFTKFLVGRDGRALKRYAPTHKPEALTADIAVALESVDTTRSLA